MDIFAVGFWIVFNGYVLAKAVDTQSGNSFTLALRLLGGLAITGVIGVGLINSFQNLITEPKPNLRNLHLSSSPAGLALKYEYGVTYI